MITVLEKIIIDGQVYITNIKFKLEERHLSKSGIAPSAYVYQSLWFNPLWEIKRTSLYLKGLVYLSYDYIFDKPIYMSEISQTFTVYTVHGGLNTNAHLKNQLRLLHSTITVKCGHINKIEIATTTEIKNNLLSPKPDSILNRNTLNPVKLFIKESNKSKIRVTRCYSCHNNLDNSKHKECKACSWIICPDCYSCECDK